MAEPKKASYLDLKDTETRNAKKQLLKSGYSSTKRYSIAIYIDAIFIADILCSE